MDWLARKVGKHGITGALASLLVLAALMLLPIDLGDGKATLLGSALGAVIAVGMAAAVASADRREEAEATMRYCIQTARDVADSLGAIVEVFDTIGDNGRISGANRQALMEGRETLVQAIGRAATRMKRIHGAILKMPAVAVDSLSDIEDAWGPLPRLADDMVNGWKFALLEDVTYPPRPHLARVARDTQGELRAIARYLEYIADGNIH